MTRIEFCPDIEDQSGVEGENSERTIRGKVHGVETLAEALILVKSGTPLFFGPLRRYEVRADRKADRLWTGEAIYRPNAPLEPGDPIRISGSTRGSTMRVKQSLNTVARFAAPGKTAEDHKGAINVTSDGVEGVDIPLPGLVFSVTIAFPPGTVNLPYIVTLKNLTTKVNNAPWKGFAKGELQFLFADFSTGDDPEKDEVTFSFSGEENLASIAYEGGITVTGKEGHHYVWFSYEEDKDDTAKKRVMVPHAAHLEQVFEYGDFTLLGLGS